MPTLDALATVGVGPVYAPFAWAFGGQGTEPVRTLTQEYGATYIMVAGLLNWLCMIDLFDRTTGRWAWRLPKDEQTELAARQTGK
jgi:malonyl CoA-acyl carrier protein transacylase